MTLLSIYNGILEAVLIYSLYRENQKKKIYYNNYQQCLRALSETDPKLKEYIEKNSINKR